MENGTKTLWILGDSILRGVTHSAEERTHRLCKGHRLEKVRALGYDVQNKSRMGATVTRAPALLDEMLAKCDTGTTVLLEYGGNDCDYDWEAISQNPHGTHLPHTPERDFAEIYGEVIRRAKDSGATVAVASLIPISPTRYFDWITRGRSAENILGWLGDVSMLARWQEHYDRLVEKIAAENDCRLLDFRGAFLLSHKFSDLISGDGIHPTDAGHDLIEDTLCAFLAG